MVPACGLTVSCWDGTTLGSKAEVCVLPVIDGREISDAKLTYDVSFPASNGYNGISVAVTGEAAAAIGTAFQMQPSDIASKMVAWNSNGPQKGQIMFYGLNSNGETVNGGSTANGYGHWFNAAGNVTSWGNNCAAYTEFTPKTLTFNIGVMPGQSNGPKYTVREALVYNDGTKKAQVNFVFHITLADTTSSELEGLVTGISVVRTGLTPAITHARYNLSGQRVGADYKGIYIVNGKKYISK